MASFVQYMGVTHGRADVFVPEEFLDSADIVARLKQMHGKGMPEGIAAYMLYYPGIADSFHNGPLKNRLVCMMPSFLAALRVLPPVFLWKDPLPAPVLRRMGVFGN